MRRLTTALPLVLAATIFMAGCDVALTGDTVVLSAQISTDTNGTPVRFGFSSSEITTGRLTDVSCGCNLDVGAFLADRGYSKAEIESATVTSAKLVMLFPISERLDFLNQAILKLEASGNSATEVATLATFPASREASLTPQNSRNVAAFLAGSTFKPILQIDASRLTSGSDYEIGLVMEIRIEVQGV